MTTEIKKNVLSKNHAKIINISFCSLIFRKFLLHVCRHITLKIYNNIVNDYKKACYRIIICNMEDKLLNCENNICTYLWWLWNFKAVNKQHMNSISSNDLIHNYDGVMSGEHGVHRNIFVYYSRMFPRKLFQCSMPLFTFQNISFINNNISNTNNVSRKYLIVHMYLRFLKNNLFIIISKITKIRGINYSSYYY